MRPSQPTLTNYSNNTENHGTSQTMPLLLVLINNNNDFICIASRMLDYTISAAQDGGYNKTQIVI